MPNHPFTKEEVTSDELRVDAAVRQSLQATAGCEANGNHLDVDQQKGQKEPSETGDSAGKLENMVGLEFGDGQIWEMAA